MKRYECVVNPKSILDIMIVLNLKKCNLTNFLDD